MRKKLEGNGLWESSRMMLVEHKQRILEDARCALLQTKPDLDPQEQEEFERMLARSMEEHSAITVTLFDPQKNRQYRGIVMKVDRQLRRIKFRWSEDDWDWINLDEIVSVT
ncbi:YolD-like family protein [Paenibacillus albidus]|uniref:YolD-like family protein n=1 Tax=Paenibacillus albidus TaxID=2041023 RepID=UPI001BE85355|nr:YolD-like family protein [Paenibacillus albidus]MBT2289387.1 YolD-like family protein [Paenibacillus albidus]